MKALFLFVCLCLIATLAFSSDLMAQQRSASSAAARPDTTQSYTLKALKLENESELELDGKLDEAIWQQAEIATGFTQRTPNEGASATQKTEVRVLYTDNAIYVGAKAFDTGRDSIAATLFRKDGSAYSDWVYVGIDSYNDNRTSFSFAVNPKGVRKDILTFNNNNEDIRWDAVWEAETDIQEDGWTVEMRIPLSQLRFSSKEDEQSWGINFQRRIARNEEISFWAPTPQSASGFVSQYGELEGIKGLEEPTRLEVSPYASTSLTRAPGSTSNPFYKRNDVSFSAGADIKYGLTSDFTLTATVNPDFGQVEADPAIINLSANETFFPEQRPFFLEGTDIFQFGNTTTFERYGNTNVFYSRRIGRQPQGNVRSAGVNAAFTDRPDQTTIAGAAKVSGKTQGGFSLGVLNAFTTREKADYVTFANEEGAISVEPPTNYLVTRAKQDLKNGRTVIGGYASAVNRMIDTPYLRKSLHESAYTGGFDFEHSWNDREYILSGAFSGSSVSGSREALLRTQKSPARYYGRPDAGYLSIDPNKTSMSGYAGELSFAKYGGKHWIGSVTYSEVSPGYEVNDMGFQSRADYRAGTALLQYRENNASDPIRSYSMTGIAKQVWNFGGDKIQNLIGLGGRIQFSNLWGINVASDIMGERMDDRLLRGGPLASRPSAVYASAILNSDRSKKVSFYMGHLRGQTNGGGYKRNVFLDVSARPAPNVQISINPDYSWSRNTAQYVRKVKDPYATSTYGVRYVFADIDQQTLSTSFRLDWTFSTNMSLQTYARPYIAVGNYYNYKEFTTPRRYEFDVYGVDRGIISKTEGMYSVDPDGTGPASTFSFGEKDFNFKAIQTNAVFRWEYNPGAFLYVVWQQDRSAFARTAGLNMSRDLRGLADAEPTNVFLVKLSYWFGS